MNNQMLVLSMVCGLVLVLAVTPIAAGAVYENTLRGFRIDYPDSWAILSQDEIAETSEAVKELKGSIGGDRRDPRAFIAQEVGMVNPSWANYNEEVDQWSVNYAKIVPRVVSGMQELHDRIKQLEATVERLSK